MQNQSSKNHFLINSQIKKDYINKIYWMTLYKYLFKDLINNQINQTVLMLYGQVYLHIIRFKESRSYFYCFKISKNLKKF